MTTRNRGRRSPRRTRTSRRVWVNKFIGVGGLAVDTTNIVDLLSSAEEFMIYDATVLAVRIQYLMYTYTSDASDAIRSAGAALMTGHSNLDAADVTEGPLDSGVGPSWLWSAGVALRTDAAGLQTFNLVSTNTNGVSVKAKRRFTENNEMLFLIFQTLGEAGDTELQLQGYARTLLLVP